MSQPISSNPVPLGFSPGAARSPSRLRSDLAQYCLPAANRDASRGLAWIDSVCLLFLTIAVIGLKGPVILIKPLPPPPEEIVPVEFTPPVEEQKFEPQVTDMEEPQTTDVATDTPVVATVVAADANAVAFAVPVEGPVTIAASPRFAQAPPPAPPKAPPAKPRPVVFDRGASGNQGSFPEPMYPVEAQRNKQEGSLVLYVVVDENGSPTTVEVQKTSGHAILDRCALDQVKRRWRWAAGQTRLYTIPFTFRLQ